MGDSDTRHRWRAPVVLVLGVIATMALAVHRSRQPSDDRMDARCDRLALEADAPQLDAIALDDTALLALGGDALADILHHCRAIDPHVEHFLRSWGSNWTPRIDSPLSINFQPLPAAVVRQSRRTCAGDYERLAEVGNLPGRQQSYAVFELCKLETRGLLSSTDVDYVDPWGLPLWRVHQMLLESEVPNEVARRYFMAMLVAAEIDERALGRVRVHDGHIAFDLDDLEPKLVELPLDPEQLDALVRRCITRVSIGASEPIGNLRWLLDAELDPEHCHHDTLTLAVHEREQLLRPLRADLDLPASGPNRPFDLELVIFDDDGTWTSVGGAERGPDPQSLMAVLDRLQPSTVLVRTNPSMPAAKVVDLLRVPDVWRARKRRELKLHLRLDDSGA